ncbi:MAG TPA: hypothetical protein VF411_09490 [Bacteroidia bacterium]
MKAIKAVLVSIFLCGVIEIKAQETPATNNNEHLKQGADKARVQRMQRDKAKLAATNNKVVAVNKPTYKNPIDENDIYMGRKDEFLGNLTVNELPADFPKYEKSYGLRYYNNLVDNFYLTHKDILKEKVRQKIEHSNPNVTPQNVNPK